MTTFDVHTVLVPPYPHRGRMLEYVRRQQTEAGGRIRPLTREEGKQGGTAGAQLGTVSFQVAEEPLGESYLLQLPLQDDRDLRIRMITEKTGETHIRCSLDGAEFLDRTFLRSLRWNYLDVAIPRRGSARR